MDSRSRIKSRRLRSRLILAGHTYHTLAVELKVSESTVKAAIRGIRAGLKARRVVEAIERISHEV